MPVRRGSNFHGMQIQRLYTGSRSLQGSAKYGFAIEPLEMCLTRIHFDMSCLDSYIYIGYVHD